MENTTGACVWDNYVVLLDKSSKSKKLVGNLFNPPYKTAIKFNKKCANVTCLASIHSCSIKPTYMIMNVLKNLSFFFAIYFY